LGVPTAAGAAAARPRHQGEFTRAEAKPLFVADATGNFADTSQRLAYDTKTGQLFASPDGSAGAIELVMRARALANDIKRRENADRAVELFRQALELGPDNVDALVGVANMCSYQVVNPYRLYERDALLDEAEVLLATPRRWHPITPAF
jgi:hypothetical protein